MTCYIVGQVEITDPQLWADYVDAAKPTLVEHDVERLFSCDDPEVLEGDWFGPRTTVLKFPSREAALEWYRSDGFQAASEIRLRAANCKMILIDVQPEQL